MLSKQGHLNQMPIATKSSKIDISEENKTKIIAKLFSDRIKNGDVLFFYGEIGRAHV